MIDVLDLSDGALTDQYRPEEYENTPVAFHAGNLFVASADRGHVDSLNTDGVGFNWRSAKGFALNTT